MHTAVHWNDNAILTAAGRTPEAIHALLDRHGQTEPDAASGAMTPTAYAVYQWTSRRKIPDRWRARLIYVLLSERKLDVNVLFRQGSAARSAQRTPPEVETE